MEPAPRPRLIAGLLAVAALAALTVASLLAVGPPAVKPQDAPAGQFSAQRAFTHVETIGRKVHVAGSAAAGEVRDHIVDALTGLGYHPQVREGIGATDALGGPAMAHVRNVVAEIPGTRSTGRLVLMAHYDSVQVSYGANDDGSGVATLLETARALTAGPALRNDVVLLFTDAEEACLCGAESFVHSDPLSRDGGVVLNFESRGSTGPSIMFETAAGNARLVAEYAAAAPHPVATSMAVEVYRILPNDTDFTPLRTSGRFTGLNSAYIDGSAVYHSPEDRPGYMDVRSLQAHGDNALALTRQLGDADLGELARPGPFDATYFPVLGSLVHYPGYLVWPLAVAALVAVVGLNLLLRRRLAIGGGRLAAGFGLMLVPLVGAAVAAQALWALMAALRPGYGPMLDPWRPGWYRLAVCALVAFVVIGWFALWRRRVSAWALAAGGLGWLAVIGLAMAAATPGGSYLAALPALAGGIAGMAAVGVRLWWVRLILVTLAGAVGVVVLAPTVLLFFPALGLATGAAAALFAALLALVLLPVLDHLHPPDVASQARPRRIRAAAPAIVAAVVAVACTGIGLGVDRFDPRHPAPTQLMYALDTDTGAAYWASEQTAAGPWLGRYVNRHRDLSATFPLLHGTLLTGRAEAANLAAPAVTVDSDVTDGAIRTVTFTVHPRADARLIDVSAPQVTVRAASVRAGGVSREMTADGHGFALLFHAPPPDGVTITLVVNRPGPIRLRVSDGSTGLSGLPGFVPRPPDVGVQGSHTSEMLLVARTVTI